MCDIHSSSVSYNFTAVVGQTEYQGDTLDQYNVIPIWTSCILWVIHRSFNDSPALEFLWAIFQGIFSLTDEKGRMFLRRNIICWTGLRLGQGARAQRRSLLFEIFFYLIVSLFLFAHNFFVKFTIHSISYSMLRRNPRFESCWSPFENDLRRFSGFLKCPFVFTVYSLSSSVDVYQ